MLIRPYFNFTKISLRIKIVVFYLKYVIYDCENIMLVSSEK